jgi:hypothetical protein
VFLSDESSKTPPKVFAENTFTKNQQNRFFLGFVLSRFWAFLGEGSSPKISKNIFGPGFFFASDPPTTHSPRGFLIFFPPPAP